LNAFAMENIQAFLRHCPMPVIIESPITTRPNPDGPNARVTITLRAFATLIIRQHFSIPFWCGILDIHTQLGIHAKRLVSSLGSGLFELRSIISRFK
jgi:hypothetical protein